ncbi:MAG: transposase [Bacteroidales bacterium]|nr:transposase [Bacteroidales bacterium]
MFRETETNPQMSLFKEGNMGAPTASIRRLVAMSILKEGFSCSDEDLIEKCDYDLLTRKALGLVRMEDEAPFIDTYYLLRRRICEYADLTGENLMETCFSHLAKFQASKFKISDRSVRMDSKLIGSNIAWYPRYEFIHRTFLQEINKYMPRLNPSLRKKVQPWLEENAKQTVYRSNSETIQQRLGELGRIIYAVLVRVKAQNGLLKRVFEEQYTVEHGQATARDRKAISADNRALAVNGVFTGIQGRQSAYLLDESEGGTVRITDTRTGETYEAKLTRNGALRIPYPGDRSKYKWRYFLPKQLESMRSRKRMSDIPQEEKNKRNNVEATIFQLCFHTRNNKTRYRGKRKHELWVLARCAWINLRRLVIFEAGTAPGGTPSGQNGFFFAISAILKAMSQTFEHLYFLFLLTGRYPQMGVDGLKY